MTERGFSAKVTATSRELTHKQRVMLADTSDDVSIEAQTRDGAVLTLDVDYWAEVAIHNEHSNDKDYSSYVVVTKDGTKYKTGSKSFWNSFMDIWEDMADDDEEWQLKVYQKESKNRAGKTFITCSII